jgi:hypothetical protein
MNDKIKEFVDANKQEFYSDEPGKDLWNKIDSQMEEKKSSRVSSNLLSKFKYLGFGLSVLVIAIYFITRNMNASPANATAQIIKKQDADRPVPSFKVQQNSAASITKNTSTIAVIHVAKNKNNSLILQRVPSVTSNPVKQSSAEHLLNKDSLPISNSENNVSDQKKIKPDVQGLLSKETPDKKETLSTKNKKKEEIYIPEEPGSVNAYTSTLYEGSSLCDVVRAFKFKGSVNIDVGRDNETNVMRTTSCNLLENIPNMKVIWLKGKTDKELILSLKKKFKNILLVKSDGRQFIPEAISHYYKGLGVITEYTGKHFEIVFKDKVELLLFFKDAQEGDKIMIDGVLEAVIKNKP